MERSFAVIQFRRKEFLLYRIHKTWEDINSIVHLFCYMWPQLAYYTWKLLIDVLANFLALCGSRESFCMETFGALPILIKILCLWIHKPKRWPCWNGLVIIYVVCDTYEKINTRAFLRIFRYRYVIYCLSW